MTDKIRGSDQLKLNCSSFSALTQEEVMQVAGGNLAFFYPLINGTPAVWVSKFSSINDPNPHPWSVLNRGQAEINM